MRVGMKQVEVRVIMYSALELATKICGAIISAMLFLLLLSDAYHYVKRKMIKYITSVPGEGEGVIRYSVHINVYVTGKTSLCSQMSGE